MTWFPWDHPNLTADLRQPNRRPLSLALFSEPKRPLRPLRVVVDADLQRHRLNDPKVDFLLQLLATPPIEAMLFSPDGPPERTPKATDGLTGVESFIDWIALETTDEEGSPRVLHWKDRRPITTALRPADTALLQNATIIAKAALIGDRIGSDMFISGIESSPKAHMFDWSRLTVVNAYDALPLVALYLRRQGEFMQYRSPALGQYPSRQRYVAKPESEYFSTAAWLFVPAAASGPSSHRAVFHTPESNEHRTAVVWRIQQALQARDRLLSTLSVAPRDYQAAERAASELELILLWLMSGFDVTARLVHLGYGLAREDVHIAGWQHKRWRDMLKPVRPDLASFFRGDADAGAVLTIVRSLRNSIHGAQSISGGGLTPVVGESAMQYLVHTPRADRSSFINAIEKLGGLKAWGVQQDRSQNELWIHPGRFVERLTPYAVAAINGSLENAPSLHRRAAPIGGPYELQLQERRTLWQLGFSESDVPER